MNEWNKVSHTTVDPNIDCVIDCLNDEWKPGLRDAYPQD
jgi:hypothetical protein